MLHQTKTNSATVVAKVEARNRALAEQNEFIAVILRRHGIANA